MRIIVASAERLKLISALELALAGSALGRDVRLFLQGEAAALLALPLAHPSDEARVAVGLPDLATMLEEAAAMEVEIIACQTGLMLAGVAPDAIWQGAEMGGLIRFLSGWDGTPAVY